MTTLEHIITIARRVRTELLTFPEVPRDLAGECGLASMRIAAAIGDPRLLRVGFYMKWGSFCGKRGRYPHRHAWCQVATTIIDPTATQFSARHRAVHVAQVDEDGRYIETADTTDAINDIMDSWRGRELPEYTRLATQLRSDLNRARNGFRVGARLPVAVIGQTYGLIKVLERVEPDVRGDGIPAVYECRCARCGAIFTAKGSDVVHRRRRLCCQPRGARMSRGPRRSP